MTVNPNRNLGLLLFGVMFLLAGGVHAAEALTPVAGNPPAPDFTLRDVDGRTHKLSSLRGKVVLINFWATWCPPCRAEMPSMQRAWQKLRAENFAMLAVNVGEDEDMVFGFTTPEPLEFPLLLDRDSTVVKAWPVRALPTTFIVDPEGRIAFRAIGGREWDHPELIKKIRALMRPAGSPDRK